MQFSIIYKALKSIKLHYKSIFWALLILILSVVRLNTSNSVKEFLIPHSDKLVHIFLYTVFSILLLMENKKSKRNYFRLLFAISYGIVMELFQHYFTLYRSFELLDILANSTGVLFGFFLYKKLNLQL